MANLRLREAIRIAEQAHARSGQRFFVMPRVGSRGKLVVFDRSNFRTLRRKGYLPQEARMADVMRECFYFTPCRGGAGGMNPADAAVKRAMYFRWVSSELRRP